MVGQYDCVSMFSLPKFQMSGGLRPPSSSHSHGNGIGNVIGTVGNKASWSLSLSQTSVNISA